MLNQCANLQCGKPFLRLGEGKLFQVEIASPSQEPVASALHVRKPPHRVDRYWLCSGCAATWTLVQDPTHGVSLLNLPISATGIPGRSIGHPHETA